MTIAEAISLAVQRQQAGQLAEAEMLYRQILGQQPSLAEVRNNLGNVLGALGRVEEAVGEYRMAAGLQPGYADAPYNWANLCRGARRFGEAAELYRRALALRPDWADAWNNLGVTCGAMGKLEEAIACFRRACELSPDFAAAIMNLGGVLCQAGQFEEAIAVYRRGLALWPDTVTAIVNVGHALRRLCRSEEAVVEYEKALKLAPREHRILSSVADALSETWRYDEAMTRAAEALAVSPNYADAHNAMGTALRGKGEAEEAVPWHQKARGLDLSSPIFGNNLGVALHEAGRLEESAACHRGAIQLSPDFALAHFNLGLVLLSVGEWQGGWREYEWRLRTEQSSLPRVMPRPQWDGSALGGRRILIQAEAGFGDAIQFSRYLPLVAQRGGRIVLACRRELHRLLGGMAAVEQCIGPDQIPAEFDVYCPLMSMGRLFNTREETIPPPVRLEAPRELIEQWQERIGGGSGLKVGLCWAGRREPDPFRSIPLAALEPLASVANAQWFSLQTGAGADERPAGMRISDFSDLLGDFAETAAMISLLDLVITIDTAVAHLAGAMGKPTWVLLKKIPDWRWMLERADNPWYPDMRLFRQVKPRDWTAPVGEVVRALAKVVPPL